MRTVAGVDYYSPREIANQKLITNSKGNGDYGFILRLINRGNLKASVFNEESKTAYYLVSKGEIDKYNKRFHLA